MILRILLAVVVFLIVRALVRRRRAVAKTAAPDAVDTWVVDTLAAEFARRLSLDPVETTRSLRGEPDPFVVEAVSGALSGVEQRFLRLPSGDEVELRLLASFARGAPFEVSRSFAWADLPADVRSEFGRTGSAMVFVPWKAAWQR